MQGCANDFCSSNVYNGLRYGTLRCSKQKRVVLTLFKHALNYNNAFKITLKGKNLVISLFHIYVVCFVHQLRCLID